MKTIDSEDLWGYAKRLRFVRQAISDVYRERSPECVSVLDVGCGNGSYLSIPLAKYGFSVTGLDPHTSSIDHARRIANGTPGVRFVCGGVDALDETTFDVIILSEVLEHVTEPQTLLRASAERLKPPGIMIVTVPNGFGEFEIDSWFYRLLKLQYLMDRLGEKDNSLISTTDNGSCGHVQFFTLRRIRALFSECSLEIFREGASSFISGPMICLTLAHFPSFIRWNASVSDRMPMRLASGWYFALRKASA